MIATADPTTTPTPATAIGWADEAVVGTMAATTCVGAALAPPRCRPLSAALVGIVLVLVGLRLRRGDDLGRSGRLAVVALLTGSFLVAGYRGVAADDGFRPLPAGPLPSPVEVLGDPEPIGPVGWKIEVRLPDGHRVEAVAHGRAGTDVSRLQVGESVAVNGRLGPVGDRPWLRTRHIVARASISEARVIGGPGPWRTVVEAVRRRVGAGGDMLDERPRALYRGLVLGDDRFQPPGQTLRFRLSGLSHLLAVSGQNVAFVLAAAAPITGRLGGRRRLAGLFLVLAVFALITRLEPSVLRAVSTGGLSAWAVVTGRTRSGLGVLAVAVTGLVLIDPFLVDSIGFQLSVAASTGILVLSPALIRRLPGPAWLVHPLATGLGAQMAVAPLLSHYFGPVSLVMVPANLAAGWAAAATMVWGMTVGPVAGLLPDPVAGLIQRPAMVWLWWLETVAAAGARSPHPRPGLLVVIGFLAGALGARALPSRWPTRLVVAMAAIVAMASVPQAPERPRPCGRDIGWYPPAGPSHAGPNPSVLVLGRRAGPDAVEDCRRAGIRAVDLVVVEVGDRRAGRTVAALGEVITVGEIWAGGQHSVVGARRRLDPVVVAVADGHLAIEPDGSGRVLTTRFDP